MTLLITINAGDHDVSHDLIAYCLDRISQAYDNGTPPRYVYGPDGDILGEVSEA